MSGSGYFFIRNVKTGQVLDVYDDGTEPGTRVILFDRKPAGYDNQLWKHEEGFLINKYSQLVLEVPGYEDGGKIEFGTCLVVNSRRDPPKSRNQVWTYHNQTLMPYDPHVRVADEGGNAVAGRYIHGDVGQEWMFDIP